MSRFMIVLLSLFALGLAGWVDKKPMLTRRSDMTCTLIDNAIYVVGGCSSDQVYEANYSACDAVSSRTDIYFPASDTWETVQDAPRQRNRHVAVAVGSKLYLFGGRDTDDALVEEVDVFDIVAKTWSTLPNKFEKASSDLASGNIGSKIALFGGYVVDYAISNATHLFDPSTGTFEYDVAAMKAPRGDICAIPLDGSVYAFGGFSSDFCKPLNNLDVLSSSSSSSSSPSWGDARVFEAGVTAGDGACLNFDGKLLTLGGEKKVDKEENGQVNCYSDPVNNAEIYDPVTDKWEAKDSMDLPEGRFRFCGAVYGGKVFIFGGQGPLQFKAGYSHSLLATTQVFEEERSSGAIAAPGFWLAAVMTLAVAVLL